MGGLTRWLAADQALRVVASARRVLIQTIHTFFSWFLLDSQQHEELLCLTPPMERNGYSPFDKNLDEIKTADLAVLKTVPEGWYVEYKEKFPDQGSVAKSISALANTYGGWLFYGIKESPDGKRLAADFPGIDVQMVPTNDQQIRQAATEKINPTPFFVTKVLYGPDDSIGLSAEKAIILVHVPQGVDAPYVHSTGKIYRRVGDSSEPTMKMTATRSISYGPGAQNTKLILPDSSGNARGFVEMKNR